MIETYRFKNVVIFIQTILSFVSARKFFLMNNKFSNNSRTLKPTLLTPYFLSVAPSFTLYLHPITSYSIPGKKIFPIKSSFRNQSIDFRNFQLRSIDQNIFQFKTMVSTSSNTSVKSVKADILVDFILIKNIYTYVSSAVLFKSKCLVFFGLDLNMIILLSCFRSFESLLKTKKNKRKNKQANKKTKQQQQQQQKAGKILKTLSELGYNIDINVYIKCCFTQNPRTYYI